MLSRRKSLRSFCLEQLGCQSSMSKSLKRVRIVRITKAKRASTQRWVLWHHQRGCSCHPFSDSTELFLPRMVVFGVECGRNHIGIYSLTRGGFRKKTDVPLDGGSGGRNVYLARSSPSIGIQPSWFKVVSPAYELVAPEKKLLGFLSSLLTHSPLVPLCSRLQLLCQAPFVVWEQMGWRGTCSLERENEKGRCKRAREWGERVNKEGERLTVKEGE